MTFFRCLFAVLSASVWLTLPPASSAQQQASGVPALKVVAPNGQESILLADLHVGAHGMKQPTEAVFEGARRFVIEHGPGTPQKAEAYEGGRKAPWARGLSEAELEEYSHRASCLGPLQWVQAQLALSNKSAQVANQFAYTVCGSEGSPKSRMEWMRSYASSKNLLPPQVLEQADWVEREQRPRVPNEVSAAGLHWILNRDPQTVLSATVLAMNAGDYDAILSEVRASMGGAQGEDVFIEVMLNERNRQWMPPLRRYLDEGRAVVFVGAAHLPGPHGLIALLRSDGYVVTSIQLPARPQ